MEDFRQLGSYPLQTRKRRTIKVPYLDREESQRLLAEVKRVLEGEPASNGPMQPAGSAGG